MDLVGPIHPPSSRGNKDVLMVIDMLTGFTRAVPIRTRTQKQFVKPTETISIVFSGEVVGYSRTIVLNLKTKK